jgi:hypothetical protein
VAEERAKLPRLMKDLPGGGLVGGVALSVMDDSQGGFSVEVIIHHKVR